MIRIKIFCRLALLIVLAANPMSSFAQSAQSSVTASDSSEDISLTVGDIFEILPTSDIQNPTYSWILTQDRNFIQAGRAPTFRDRLIQPGLYTLIAEIDSQDMTQRITRTFNINVSARPLGKIPTDQSGAPQTGSGTVQTASGTNLVTTNPPLMQDTHAVLGENQQLLELLPVNPDIKPLSLDLDISKDSDGNGNPADDIDNKDTFFQNYATPLFIWFASPLTSQTMSVTTVENGGAVVQKIEVDSADYAKQNGFITSPVSITVQQTPNGTVSFAPTFVSGQTPTSPLLYTWSFGDGQQSLLMNATHTYPQNGTYTVHLQIRDLTSGQQVAAADTQVTISTATGSGNIASVASSSSVAAVNTGGGGLSIGRILLFAGIFIVFLIAGALVVFLLGRLRRGKPLDQTFAELEKNIVGKEGGSKTPPPLSIAPAATSKPTQTEVVKREENAASPAKPETPRIDEAAAPSWLKKGLASQPAQLSPQPPAPASKPQTPSPAPAPKPQAAPAPAPKPQSPMPAPAPKPAEEKPRPSQAAAPQPSASQPAGPVPAWLQQPSSMPATTAPAPAPKPSPTPLPPQPKPAPTPAPAPLPSQPKPAPTPAPSPSPQKAPVADTTAAPMPAPAKPSAPSATPTQAPATAKPNMTAQPSAPMQPVDTAPKPAPSSTQPPLPPVPAANAAPQTTAAAAPVPAKPATPAAADIQKTTPPVQTDNTIAVIHAESIEEQKKEEPPKA